jgi:ATP-dependent helicase/nuclease subunit A
MTSAVEPADARRAAADAHAREEATDPARSFVLQAPAGSGKTTVLTQRFLRLLESVDEPEEILAVTFTRKAAAQMRARIVSELAKDPAPLRTKMRAWDLANHPGRLRIQTLDAFNFWLASQLPVTAKAGAALSVDDRPEELYQRAARATLFEGEQDAVLAADIELLFERLDNNWDRVEGLLAQMLEKRAHWLRHVLGPDPQVLRARMTASLQELIGDAIDKARRLWPPGLQSVAETLPDVGALGVEHSDLPAWQRFVGLVLTRDGTWRKSPTRTQCEPGAARAALRTLIARLSSIAGAREALCEIVELPSPTLDADDALALDALSRVLRTAAAYLQIEFSAAATVDHTYVAGAAREALAEGSLPTDLALRAGLALKHVLVDEFQDISLSQFDLLETLTIGWEQGDGRTLFLVGDPMQSIYQFREAEVGLFLRARDRGIGSFRLEALHLTRNFRSVAPLIDWTNAHFARLLQAPDDVRMSAVAFAPALATRAPGVLPALGLSLFAPGDRIGEANAIAAQIVALQAQNPHASVAVLVAARSHAAPISAALDAAGVACVGVKLVPLAKLSIISDLVALTRALHHLGDRGAWLIVLRAPWCGVSLATLAVLSPRNDPLLLWEAMGDAARLAGCGDADRTRLARVRGVLARALSAREPPLAEWLESTWLQLGGADAYPKTDLTYARAFFASFAERAASGQWRGPNDLSRLMQHLYAEPQSTSANPVQIMTIHHAKGLEFEHVFLPCLERDLNRGREPLMTWLDLPRSCGGSDLLVAPVSKTGAEEGGALGAYLKRLIRVRAGHEQLRLLYVACTRARESLHMSGTPLLRADGTRTPHAGTLLARLWPALLPEDYTTVVAAAPEAAPAVRDASLKHLPANWRPITLPGTVAWPRLPIEQRSLEAPEFSWVGETARHVGTVVHAALQHFAALAKLPSVNEIRAASAQYVRQLARLGVPERDLERAAERVVEALTRTCRDERGRWILSTAHRESASELALTGIAAGRLQSVVIDRSFIDADGTRWVIDFKTSSHAGGDVEVFLANELARYRAQLTSHCELARALGPEPVRAALYLPLLGAFRELEPSEGVGDRE